MMLAVACLLAPLFAARHSASIGMHRLGPFEVSGVVLACSAYTAGWHEPPACELIVVLDVLTVRLVHLARNA